VNVLRSLRDEILWLAGYLQDLTGTAIDLPRDKEGNELLRDFPEINIAAHKKVFMAPIGVAQRVRVVLKYVDFAGQAFFSQSFFCCRQASLKQPFTGFIMDDKIKDVVALGGGILRMATRVLVKPGAVHEKRIGRPAVRNEAFKNISQHLLHRQIDATVRRKDKSVLILQTENASSQGAGLQHVVNTSPVSLVCLVYLVLPVSLVQPNKRVKPNKPNKQVRW
jgi:hypothetical protein